MNPACLSDVCEDGNYFLKLKRAQLKSHIVALAVSGLNSEFQSRLQSITYQLNRYITERKSSLHN